MTPTGFLFATVGMASCAGMVAGIAKPAWFRFNGAVPTRKKIGTIWLVLAAICGLGTLAQSKMPSNAGAPSTETVPWTQTGSDTLIIDPSFPGEAVTIDSAADSVVMDAAKAADAATDITTDVTLPEPPPAPPPMMQVPEQRSPTRRQNQK